MVAPIKMIDRSRAFVSKEWLKFLSGKWQKEMPHKVGDYPVADRLGNIAGTIPIYLHKEKYFSAKDWSGWWWSDPQPPLPKPTFEWDPQNVD